MLAEDIRSRDIMQYFLYTAVASSPPNQSTSNDIGVIVGIVVAVVVVAAVVIFIVCILWKRKQAETKNCENAGDDIVLSPPTDSSH